VAWCEEFFQSAGPDCKDELTATYVCYLDDVQAQDPNNPMCPIFLPDQCASLDNDASQCITDFGCRNPFADPCITEQGPNSEQGCVCSRACKKILYQSKCWTDGTTSTCDCLVDMVSVGTCQGGPELSCDRYS
jgi:hypothetical protein